MDNVPLTHTVKKGLSWCLKDPRATARAQSDSTRQQHWSNYSKLVLTAVHGQGSE